MKPATLPNTPSSKPAKRKTTAMQVRPKAQTFDKMTKFKKKYGVSYAAFCNAALELAVPLLEAGDMALVNGRLQFVTKAA